ncbi:hydrogenase maturation nickel metallochaperone HypA/HybF [Fodinicola feengrottensis]|uniref:Hydrogenase maturation factor HypA n=1 Tax=Fodinicola feengrottensis TaxID=435914 RepID=A0ABN2I2T0_9ACTN|nr:hydrogenase maturation nickel metallochaperone HypA [Fodinicola feengrottensis]
MHELSITQSIVEAVTDKTGDRQVRRVELEVGKLAGVVADSVLFCFELVTEGTTLAGARLDIVEKAGRGTCRGCRADLELTTLIVLCDCGSADVDVTEGTELRIRSVEVV